VPKLATELTALSVSRLKSPGYYAVGNPAGLYLQILGGSRSWILRYSLLGKRREMGLGAYPGVTLAQAREHARLARAELSTGRDPLLIRKQQRSEQRAVEAAMVTFDDAASRFIDAKRAEWKNPKHADQWTSTLKSYASPVFGHLMVGDVAVSHVMSVLSPIWKNKTETAKRLRGRIEQVLDWAKVHGYRTGENPAQWRGHLDKLLAAPNKVTKVVHHKALPISEVPRFMAQLRGQAGLAARALEFAILTAARSGNVRHAVWSEIDIPQRLWTVPAAKMKAGREHRVPLSDEAISLLESIPQGAQDALVFPSARGSALSDMTLNAVLRRMEVDAVPHGFRSTFRDWAAERSFDREVAELSLAHVNKDKTEAAYFRSDLIERRRELLDAWGAFTGQNFTMRD